MKQESIAIDKKTTFDLKTTSERLTVAGTVVTIGAAYGICILLFLFWQHPLTPFVQAAVFFLAGLIHISIIRKGANLIASTGEWIYTLVATGMILLLLGTSALWGPELPVFLIVSSACAFLLPFSVTEMWRAHLQLALDGAKVWYPTDEMLANYPTFYFNSTPMRFRVLQGKGKPNRTLEFKVSNEMPLGKIFYDLVQNKNRRRGKEIALADAEQNLYCWVFFTSDGWILTRPLDPQKTLEQNGLHEKKVIYAQKVSLSDISRLKDEQT